MLTLNNCISIWQTAVVSDRSDIGFHLFHTFSVKRNRSAALHLEWDRIVAVSVSLYEADHWMHCVVIVHSMYIC